MTRSIGLIDLVIHWGQDFLLQDDVLRGYSSSKQANFVVYNKHII